MRSWLVALGIGFAVSACLVEPDHVLACGDGYVDALVGEECDPNDPRSFEDACLETSRRFGVGGCDPDTCEIVDTAEQCAFCGDGIIDAAAGEECDGSNIGAACKAGGEPTCTPLCTIDLESCEQCGDGEPDPDEECDPGATAGGLVAAYPCAGMLPRDVEKPYTSGTAVLCLDECMYDRSGCGYCGDGVQDPPLPNAFHNDDKSDPELCDGDDFDLPALADEDPTCAEPDAQPIVTCNADCRGVSPPDSPLCL